MIQRHHFMTRHIPEVLWICFFVVLSASSAWSPLLTLRQISFSKGRQRTNRLVHQALSDAYFENDLVAVQPPNSQDLTPRLCAVKPGGTVVPLCLKEDDVETDLFVDPREYSNADQWDEITDEAVIKLYGEGFYGQRPVPSLGGGPGYGAEADDVWSVDEDVLGQVRADGVLLPVLDVGIAHGEKARGGSF